MSVQIVYVSQSLSSKVPGASGTELSPVACVVAGVVDVSAEELVRVVTEVNVAVWSLAVGGFAEWCKLSPGGLHLARQLYDI